MTFMRLGMAMCAVGGVLAAQAPFPPLAPRIELHECSLSSIAATVTWPAVAASDDALDAYEVSYRVAQKSAWTSWSSSLTGRISTVPSLGVQTVVSRGVSGPITGGFFRLTSSYASVADVDTRTGLAVSPLIAFDASAATVQAALQSIHDVLHVQVTRQGPDTTGGYAWHIEFHESHPRPMLGIHTNLLDNGSVTIAQLQPPTSMCTAECVATVSGLAHSTDYVFRVRAHAATGGWGAWSPVTAPWSTCILALPSMPVQVVATSATVTTISITWSPRIHPTVTSLPTLSYSVASRCHDDVFWRTIKTDPSSTFATITTLRPNTMCQVQVFATNAMGNGPPSDVVVVRSLPGTPLPPQNVTLSCVVGMVLQLLYTPTSDDGGARPVTYVAAYKAVDAIDWIRLNEFKWSAPAPYTRYVARVASVNPLGTSDWVVTNIVRSDRPRVTVSAAVTIRPHQFTLLAATLGDAANRNDKYYMGGTSNGGRLGGDGQPGVVYMRLFALDGLLLKQDALYYTGTAQNYTIPDNPKYERAVVDVYAWGGGGGSGSQAAIDLGVGGGGGFARASFSTSRGAVFQVSVGGGGGGGGSGAGGFGGGGRGGRGDFVGGGGGGATMVYKEKPVGTWSLLVVAPGGGGGGASAVCCSAGGAAGGLNGTAGTAPTAAQMGLPLPVASRDEFHSKFEFGDFRDFMGASAYDNNLEVGYAPGADFSALASPGGGGSGVAGGEAGHQSSYASVFNQVSSNGQERVGGVGGDGKKGGGGGGGGYFGGGGGGGGLQGAGGGGGSGYISMSAIEPLSFPLDPPVPEQVTVVPGVSSLTVKWRAPTNTPISFRPQNEGYLIELAVGDSNEDFSPVDGTTDKHFVVMGLEPATTYAIRVKLIMAGNVGGYSPRVISQTLARPINSWRLIRPMLLMQSNVGSGFRHNDDVFSSPSPRRGHSMVVLGEYSYLFGGFGPGYPCQRGTSDVCVTSALETNELWRYHSATQSWLHVQDVVGSVRPPRREKHTASALGKSKMLVFGGRQLAGPSFNDVWQLDVGTPTTLVSDQSTANVLLRDGADTWTTAVASTDPTATCIQSMQVVLNITHSCLNTLEVFLYGPGPSTLPALQQDGKTGSDVARDVMWTMDGGRQFDGSERISSRYPSTR
ncbi:hypothetical protein, variant [Aphanomyces astaci]|nr:hypothetical protein, variant [Aphanomyces astaci]ETV76516.1 hypothetical protein, variant [Aphanomyces astaci]|eukprot:XP_009834061.1 hypothetical protein, variant [Aphanomyces astaci]